MDALKQFPRPTGSYSSVEGATRPLTQSRQVRVNAEGVLYATPYRESKRDLGCKCYVTGRQHQPEINMYRPIAAMTNPTEASLYFGGILSKALASP
jgi:hypothetical protein